MNCELLHYPIYLSPAPNRWSLVALAVLEKTGTTTMNRFPRPRLTHPYLSYVGGGAYPMPRQQTPMFNQYGYSSPRGPWTGPSLDQSGHGLNLEGHHVRSQLNPSSSQGPISQARYSRQYMGFSPDLNYSGQGSSIQPIHSAQGPSTQFHPSMNSTVLSANQEEERRNNCPCCAPGAPPCPCWIIAETHGMYPSNLGKDVLFRSGSDAYRYFLVSEYYNALQID